MAPFSVSSLQVGVNEICVTEHFDTKLDDIYDKQWLYWCVHHVTKKNNNAICLTPLTFFRNTSASAQGKLPQTCQLLFGLIQKESSHSSHFPQLIYRRNMPAFSNLVQFKVLCIHGSWSLDSDMQAPHQSQSFLIKLSNKAGPKAVGCLIKCTPLQNHSNPSRIIYRF